MGIGGIDSMTTPTILESLQHVFIKKVAVNSGGKHCLALTADGDGMMDYSLLPTKCLIIVLCSFLQQYFF